MKSAGIQPSSVPAFRFLTGTLIGTGTAAVLPTAGAIVALSIATFLAVAGMWRRKALWTFWSSALGCGMALWLQLPPLPSFIGWYPTVQGTIDGTVRGILRHNPTHIWCIVDGTLMLQGSSAALPASILLKIRHPDSITGTIAPGAHLYSAGDIRPPRPPQLFTDFDETLFARSRDFQWYAEAEGNRVSASIASSPLLWQWRKALQHRITSLFDSTTAPLFVAMLTGDRSLLSYSQKRLYQLTGTAHVFAVSGFHVGLIALIAFALLSPLRGSWLFPTLTSAILLLFMLLTGAQPSTVRATAMAMLFLWLLYFERSPQLLNIVAFVALLFVLISPAQLLSISFQLSFAAVFSIAIFYPFFTNRLQRLQRHPWTAKLIPPLAVSFAASLATAPLTAYHFQQFSWIAPLSNLCALPIISLAIIFAVCALGSSFLSVHLGLLYSATAHSLLWLGQQLLEGFSRLHSSIEGPIALPLAIVYSATIAILLSTRSKRILPGILVTSAILLLWLLTRPAQSIIAARDETVLFHDPATHCLLIQDRRPYQPFHLDLGLLRYLTLLPDTTIVYAGGPIAMAHLRLANPAIDTLLLPTFLFSTELFWSAVDHFDSLRIPIRVLPDTVWQPSPAWRYSINRNVLYLATADTAVCLPQLRIGTTLRAP